MRYIWRFHSMFWMEFKSSKGGIIKILIWWKNSYESAESRERPPPLFFLAYTLKTKATLVQWGGLKSGWVCSATHQSCLIWTVGGCRSSLHTLMGRNQTGKSHFNITNPPPGICSGVGGWGSSYHIYWLCFYFPLGKPAVMRKEMEEDCFSPSALSTQ